MRPKFKLGDRVRVYRDLSHMHPHDVGMEGTIVYAAYLSNVQTPNGIHYVLDEYQHILCHEEELELLNKKGSNMSKTSLTKRVRNAFRSKEDRALIEGGFMYETGSLTKEGRKVVINLLLEQDAKLKAKVVEAALAIAEEAKSKK